MKRILPYLLAFLIVLPIGLYVYSKYGLPLYPQVSTGLTRGTVEFKSEYSGYTVTTTRFLDDLFVYLDHIGFWKENVVTHPKSHQPVTATHIVAIFVDTPQGGGIQMVMVDGKPQAISSFSTSYENETVTIRVFVDPIVAAASNLGIDNSFSTSIMRASYLLLQKDSTEWQAQFQTSQTLINDWYQQPFATVRKLGTWLQDISRWFTPVVYAQACASWSCGTAVYVGACSVGGAPCTAGACSSCSPSGCDPNTDPYCTCLTGSCILTQTGCGVPEFSESGATCSYGCPPGHCTKNSSCSCSAPTPTPNGGGGGGGGGGEVCGNGTCGVGETCSSCVADCGACASTPTSAPPGSTSTPLPTSTPVSYGTIRARAVAVDSTDTSCAAVKAVPTTDGQIQGALFQFTSTSASQPAPQTQTGANYVTFANAATGSYVIDPTIPSSNWVYVARCWTNETTGATGETLSSTLGANQTLRWDIGYTLGTPWVQVQGGDVYGFGTIRSYIPNVAPRAFVTDSASGYPGIVSYGTGIDFESDPYSTGTNIVSRTNWQVNSSRPRINYYDYFYRKYGSPATATTDSSFSNLLGVTKPPSSPTPYYVVGDMTTTGNWSVGNNESIVIIVNGNVTIGGNITIVGSGFVAFIVNGTITVSDTVGTTASSVTPVVEGVYIAMKADQTGGFYTGLSTSALTPRFVGKGMFIADTFGLQRDLEGYGVGNTGSAAELFMYNPRLLITMPDEMKENSVTWQEVAP